MAKRDYYEVLGISKSATQEDIKKAYRAMARKYHPDINKEPGAEEKFKEVNEAYETLSDEQKRSRYDQYGFDDPTQGFNGAGGFSGFSNGSGFGGFEDIFSSFFGGGRQQQSSGGRGPRKGNDLEKTMSITFMEAIFGTKKTIRVSVDEECAVCGGTGAYSKNDIHTCSKCNGTGYVYVTQQSIFGVTKMKTVCPKCNGKGKEVTKKCDHCGGKGRIRKTKDVEVKIPAGIDNGMTLRMEGYGESGYDDGPAGDLFITFTVLPHNNFKRDGVDIYLTIPLSFTQAALGDTIEVPTVSEPVSLKIPAGTQSGTKFRLKGRGVANVKSSGIKGDQYVIIQVTTPTNLSDSEKKLFMELGNVETKEKKSPWEKFKQFFS